MEQYFMRQALHYAQLAYDHDEVPVGAIIVKGDEIISFGYNERESQQNPLAHAEIIAIHRAAQALGTWRLNECDLYVTLEPCPMCAGAIMQARLKRVIFGASDPKSGSFGSLMNLNDVQGLNHYPEIIHGVLAEESKTLLVDFFKARR